MNTARLALAGWLLLAAPAFAQTSAANGNPQQEVVAAPEAGTGLTSAGYLRTRGGGQVENTVGIAANDVLRF